MDFWKLIIVCLRARRSSLQLWTLWVGPDMIAWCYIVNLDLCTKTGSYRCISNTQLNSLLRRPQYICILIEKECDRKVRTWKETCLYRNNSLIVDIGLTHSLSLSLSHGAEPFLRGCQLCSYSRTSQHFMELESSLPCSQEPSTGPYSEPDQSNPYHPILSL
jgi:hypothetical protein